MSAAHEQVENLEVSEDGEGFYAVAPLSTCPHLSQVQPSPPEIDVKKPCKTCGVEGENWICLTCYEVHCGRYVGGHALEHTNQTKHAMALSFSDLSSWCYECNSYVHNEAMASAKNAVYIDKFGQEK